MGILDQILKLLPQPRTSVGSMHIGPNRVVFEVRRAKRGRDNQSLRDPNGNVLYEEKPERGVYRITERGIKMLDGLRNSQNEKGGMKK